jgi:glycogen synthase
MRILVVTNFYPPHHVGGYELGCRDVVQGLLARGHDVRVLTSTYQVRGPRREGSTYRWLRPYIVWSGGDPYRSLPKLFLQEATNQQAFRQLCRSFRPDVVYLWNLTHISPCVAFTAEQLGLPVAYFVSDGWLAQWDRVPWFYRWTHRPQRPHRRAGWQLCRLLLQAFALLPPSRIPDLRYAQFASHYLRGDAVRAGLPVANARVIHWGVDVDAFSFRPSRDEATRLLFVGQVVRHKGVHTAVEALKQLVQKYGHRSATLTVAGGSVLPDDERSVRESVVSLGLQDHVSFVGQTPRTELPDLYRSHDILVFPSIWDEPFSIVVLEAMSSGLAVVGTQTGGSGEILEDGRNALVFPAGNAPACAAQTSRLLRDNALLERVRREGRRTIEERFQLRAMLGRVETALVEATG